MPDETLNAHQDFLRTQSFGNLVWDDIQNDPGAGFIAGSFIEYEAVPEPTSLTAIIAVSFVFRRRARRGWKIDSKESAKAP